MACFKRLQRNRLPLLLALLATASLASCMTWPSPRPNLVWDERPSGVSFSTHPPGAIVVIDGQPSGFATPCIIDLEESDSYRVEFELNGYQTAGLYVTPNRQWSLVPYNDASTPGFGWQFPLWLPFGDFWMPLRTNTALSPSRIHLRLRLGADNLDAPPPASDAGVATK